MKQSKTSLGIAGENLAKEYLKQKKYNILDHNFRCRFGEIDLVARKDKAFHFIEVKYRRSVDYGLPQEAVVRRKQQRVRNTALIWLKRRHLPLDTEIHFDVLAITELAGKMKYEYIEDAF
ncbi:MAG: YraN family protein [candidate division WOR-3 bacterium]|nr:MAG: YraN family protein [candidate division WOR-3 bacterium]